MQRTPPYSFKLVIEFFFRIFRNFFGVYLIKKTIFIQNKTIKIGLTTP
jgi:hypothetical protein